MKIPKIKVNKANVDDIKTAFHSGSLYSGNGKG